MSLWHRQFWMANRTDGLTGVGTLNSPWDGRGVNFIKRLKSVPEYSVVHLLPGIYVTSGYWRNNVFLKDGIQIVGSGASLTTVQLTETAEDGINDSGANTVFFTGYRHGKDVTVRDLTIDLNYPNVSKLPNLTLQGVVLFGSNHKIQNVTVVNGVGKQNKPNANPEAFLLSFGEFDGTPANDNLIEGCEVHSFVGGYCTAIGAAGCSANGTTSGIIRNNKVYLPTLGGGEFGYGFVRSSYGIVENNFQDGGMRGFNLDTGMGKDLTIRNNLFRGIKGHGILVGNGQNVLIDNNVVSVAGSNSHAVVLSGQNSTFLGVKRVLIRGNLLRTTGSPSFAVTFWENAPDDWIVDSNIIDFVMQCQKVPDNPGLWKNNSYPNGFEMRPGSTASVPPPGVLP